jgi:DNA-directed RNA polymerase specialized sigma24 family protein
VAQELARRAVSRGEKLLGDPALALTLFEETAATVSSTIRNKTLMAKEEIRDLRSYLFQSYLNRISKKRRRQPVLKNATDKEWQEYASQMKNDDVELQFLAKELLGRYDTVTQEIVHRRLESYSPKEIEEFCGIPAHEIVLRFKKVLRDLQKLVRARGRFR